jgi:hypothetical protein
MNLQMTRGDSPTFALLTSMDCSTAVQLIFTAKYSTNDPDANAVFQKTLGAGLAVASATIVTMDMVATDTSAMLAKARLVWDLQAQFAGGGVITVSKGTLLVDEDATRLMVTSVPVQAVNTSSTVITSIGPLVSGNDWNFTLSNIFDRLGVAITSLAGWSAVFTVKTQAGAAVISRTTGAGQIDVTSGPGYSWTVPNSVTGLAAGTYNFDMTLTDNLGQVATTTMGTLTVVAT